MKPKNNPKISVIIPTFNRKKLLPRAIKSVLNQTFQDFEIIIVDDGSTDNTEKIVKEYIAKDNRIQYIKQYNNGPSSARNTGIKKSTDQYIALLDSDDEWLPEKLEKQITLFSGSKKNNLGFVGCCTTDVVFGKKSIKPNQIQANNFLEGLLEGRLLHETINSSSVIVDKRVFENVGYFDESLRMREDYDLWVRIADKYDFDMVQESLVFCHKHESNFTNNNLGLDDIESLKFFIDKHNNLYNQFPKALSRRLQWLGTLYMLNNKTIEARKYFIESIKKNPKFVRNYINLPLTFFGEKFYKKLCKIYYKNNI